MAGEVKQADWYNKIYKEQIIGVPKAMTLIGHWANRASRHISSGSVLDLGCGLGVLADKIEGEYTGVDFCKVAVEYAKKHCKNKHAKFILADILKFAKEAKDDSFDTIVFCEVLEHLEHPEDIIREAKRIARNQVVVTVPMASPNLAHVKHIWSMADVQKLLGPLAVIEDIRGFWLSTWKKGRQGDGFQEEELMREQKVSRELGGFL